MRIKFYTDRPFGLMVKSWLIYHGEEIVDKNPEIIISCYNPKIIPKKELTVPAINFHPGYLPTNRGMYPHIWPLIDGSQAGVTIHYIGDGIDDGYIIGQKKINVYPTDIANDLEERTQKVIFELFKKVWPKIKKSKGKVKAKKQIGEISYHSSKEIQTIQRFDKDTIRRLRACTFNDRSYAYFIENGQKYYVGIKFFEEEDIKRFERMNHG